MDEMVRFLLPGGAVAVMPWCPDERLAKPRRWRSIDGEAKAMAVDFALAFPGVVFLDEGFAMVALDDARERRVLRIIADELAFKVEFARHSASPEEVAVVERRLAAALMQMLEGGARP